MESAKLSRQLSHTLEVSALRNKFKHTKYRKVPLISLPVIGHLPVNKQLDPIKIPQDISPSKGERGGTCKHVWRVWKLD